MSRECFAPTIRRALAKAGVAATDIQHAAVHEPIAGLWRDIAPRDGMAAPNHASDVATELGDLGAAHGLFALALATARAKPGERILLAGFGSGCDALVLEMTAPMPGAAIGGRSAPRGLAFGDYLRFLSLNGALELDWGVRSEFEQKAQATVLERYGRDMIGFVGGSDAAGNVQFPKSRIPVRPDADGPEPMEDVRLAEESRAHRFGDRRPAQFHARSAILVRTRPVRQRCARDDGIHRRGSTAAFPLAIGCGCACASSRAIAPRLPHLFLEGGAGRAPNGLETQ